HGLAFGRVCQVLKGWQFEIVWKNRDQHDRIIQNDAPLPQWPRHACWFAVLQPLRQLISLASADVQVQFRAGEIQPIGNSAEVLGLVSYVSDLRGPEIGLRSGPAQRSDEGVGIQHRGQSGEERVAASEISFKARKHRIFKLQAPEKPQTPTSKSPAHDKRLGIWIFSGAWCLEPGAFS